VDKPLLPLANGGCGGARVSSASQLLSITMNHLAKPRKAEADLGRQSKQVAEDERELVAPDRLAQTITEFVEWRAFSYWLRLIVETQGFVSDPMTAILQERCPGFLEYAASYAAEHPREPAFLWLRFLEWTDESSFRFLLLRAGATRLATTRLAIPGWISSGRTGNSAAERGSFSRLHVFRVLRRGASLRSSTVDSHFLRFHKLRYPKCGVLIKRGPFQNLGLSVKEGLQGSFIDPAVPLPVEKSGFNPRLKAQAPHVKFFGQFAHRVSVLESSRDSTLANHVPNRLLGSLDLFGDLPHAHVVQGFDNETVLHHRPAPASGQGSGGEPQFMGPPQDGLSRQLRHHRLSSRLAAQFTKGRTRPAPAQKDCSLLRVPI
jgi:hypothetical protein